MTHLLDTSALLAHYLGEPGAERVQGLFEDNAVGPGTSILALFEFELSLHLLGLDATARAAELTRYRRLLDEVVDVTEAVRSEAMRLRIGATARVAAMDVLIGASASLTNATLVHRDPHFASISNNLLRQEVLPAK
jgi:predicted nucleic acid-binding protein